MQCVQFDAFAVQHVLMYQTDTVHHSEVMFFGCVCSVYTGTGTVYVCIHVKCGGVQCLLCWPWCFLLAHVGMGSH